MRKGILKLFFLITLFLPNGLVVGAVPVIDATNLAQNIIQITKLILSNINEAKMIVNQIKQLQNDLKNLTELDFDIIDSYHNQLTNLFEEVGSVNGLMQNLSNLQYRFEELYPEYNNEFKQVSGEMFSKVMRRNLDESREMMLGASKVGASVLENIEKSKHDVDGLVVKSQHAIGNLQALQAGNQLTATVSNNLANLNAQVATLSQAHMSFIQRINTAEAYMHNRAKHILDGETKGAYSKVPLNPW